MTFINELESLFEGEPRLEDRAHISGLSYLRSLIDRFNDPAWVRENYPTITVQNMRHSQLRYALFYFLLVAYYNTGVTRVGNCRPHIQLERRGT